MAPDSISRADIVSDGPQVRRGSRYRSSTEKPTAYAADDTDSDVKTSAKVPTYRVRGRTRNNKPNTENEMKNFDATTAKAISESRPVRRKFSNQSTKNRAAARNENQSSEVSNKDIVSSSQHATQTISSRKSATESDVKTSATELPDNHRKSYSDPVNTRKTSAGRRYRVRVVDANAINANSPTSESEKKVATTTSATTVKSKKTEREAGIEDELNYPEHFKALLKSKKSTSSPSSASSRINHFAPKKPATATTSAATEVAPTSRTAYKHKKIERPNIKLLFPSLQKSSSTTAETTTLMENDPTATDDMNTETATPVEATTTAKMNITTANNQVGGVKFSSKIRTENDDAAGLPAYRARSSPLVFDTLKSSTQRNSDGPSTNNHRFSSVSFRQGKME